MNIFYTPYLKHKTYILTELESKHCIKVLRLKTNDIVFLIDGIGGFFKAKIIDSNYKRCAVEIIESKFDYKKRNYKLHIAIAPTKNISRFEWFLEKATEIGIDEISPIICRYSERKIIKHERLNKIITSATKQSLKAYHPKLNELTTYKNFINKYNNKNSFIAHCYDSDTKIDIKNVIKAQNNSIILIGPEGDFSLEEVEMAKKKNYTEINLSNSRLRTETAGIVACHAVSFIN